MNPDKNIKAHWAAQEPSFFRPPGQRDKGITIVNSRDELSEAIEAELAGQEVALYKNKTAAIELISDPLARSQELIRKSRSLTSEQFKSECRDALDLELWLLLYGEMTDDKKVKALSNYEKKMYERQKDALEANRRAQKDEEQRVNRMLEAKRKMNIIKKQEQELNQPKETDESE